MTHPELVLPVLAVVAMATLATLNKVQRGAGAASSTPATEDSSVARLDGRIARPEQAVDVIAIEWNESAKASAFSRGSLRNGRRRRRPPRSPCGWRSLFPATLLAQGS